MVEPVGSWAKFPSYPFIALVPINDFENFAQLEENVQDAFIAPRR